jgi:hypothetical protein
MRIIKLRSLQCGAEHNDTEMPRGRKLVHGGPSKLVSYHKREGTYHIGDRWDHARYHKRERTCRMPTLVSKGTRAVACHECIDSILLGLRWDLTSDPYSILLIYHASTLVLVLFFSPFEEVCFLFILLNHRPYGSVWLVFKFGTHNPR